MRHSPSSTDYLTTSTTRGTISALTNSQIWLDFQEKTDALKEPHYSLMVISGERFSGATPIGGELILHPPHPTYKNLKNQKILKNEKK